MTYKIKKLFSYLFKTRTLILSVILVFFCLFLPVQYASANWVWDMISGIATIPFAFFYLLLGYMSILFSGFTGIVLNWVIGPNFTTLSYTNPAGNPIIKAGLEITQGFVNMLLVLILVYIAIATILRLAGHETKKLLVTFVVVALLVNFAPVICGLVVDASNIIMNFFISELAGLDVFTTNMGRISESFISMFSWDQFNSAERSWARLFSVIGVTAFNFFLGFALLIFAVLFVFRHIMIWILVILSPLAFACYILPRTREYFNKWWKQFLSWSFIGVTAGFFLYLGFRLVLIAPEIITPPETEFGTTFDGMLPYYVPIAFLFIGLIIGLQTSAMGASTVINLTKKGQKWAGGKIAQRGIRPVLEKMRAKEAVGKISRGIEKVPVARWFLPEAVRKYGEMRPAIEKGQQRAKAYSSQVLGHRLLKGADTETDAAGDLLEMIERGDEQDIYMEARKLKKWKGKSDQEILTDKDFQRILARPLQIGASGGMLNSKFLRAAPRLARVAWHKKIGSYADHEKYGTEKDAVREATRQARRPNINQMERETFEDEVVVETMLEKGREVPEAVVAQVKKGQETMLNTIDKLFSNYIDNVLSKSGIKANTDLAAKVKSGKGGKDLEKAWEKYREHFKEVKDNQGKKKYRGEGYFKYVEGQRAKEMGWRRGQYIAKEEREKGPSPTTPLGGAGVRQAPEKTKPLKPGEETEEEKKNKPKK